jgi:hypothetical protein
MSAALEAHIDRLTSFHAGLDKQIMDELRRPLPDHLRLTALKREKLRTKQKILSIRSATQGRA